MPKQQHPLLNFQTMQQILHWKQHFQLLRLLLQTVKLPFPLLPTIFVHCPPLFFQTQRLILRPVSPPQLSYVTTLCFLAPKPITGVWLQGHPQHYFVSV
ncbi:hypothetical protein EBP35_25980 [Salmonella enterica subsp. enterica serovar Antsalova]|nr:hypothetical protein [Salmonella enterica subsp. enterica serovar Antsalova]